MKSIMTGIVTALMTAGIASLAWSKGATVKLVVRGEGLSAPLEIEDSTVVGLFNVWNGPGVRVNGEQTHRDPANSSGAFIDWPSGRPTERPAALARYEVTFVVDGRVRGEYTILYELDPSAPGGYVYLPGFHDAYGRNQSLIVHGIEGYWFRSSGPWERHIRPIIASNAVTLDEAAIEARNRSLATGDFRAAEAMLHAALERDAADMRARALLAYSLINQLKSDEAAVHLDGLVEQEYGFLGELGYQWARYGRNPAAVAQAVLAISDPDARAHVLVGVADGWAEVDAEAAQDWLLNLPIGDARDAALGGFARGLANTGSPVAPSVMNAFSSDGARELHLQHVATRLASHSPEHACTLFPTYVADPQKRERLQTILLPRCPKTGSTAQ